MDDRLVTERGRTRDANTVAAVPWLRNRAVLLLCAVAVPATAWAFDRADHATFSALATEWFGLSRETRGSAPPNIEVDIAVMLACVVAGGLAALILLAAGADALRRRRSRLRVDDGSA